MKGWTSSAVTGGAFSVLLSIAMQAEASTETTKAEPHLSKAYQQQCGWVDNPSSANLFFENEAVSLIIFRQGLAQDDASIDMIYANRDESQVLRQSSAHALCACIEYIAVDDTVTELKSFTQQPLKSCLSNPALRALAPIQPKG
ncbi:hypothetical protein VST7929_01106 [Vibrio stylophorae]|uniref:Uncharacterized protein n=1 Tax=Vibrio stylophorae TaxID=659351 RepID=A0ABM8ZTJ0_9VIBR|nr:DUF4087 domain-containing protein [Vibrio stylophorae]CAH0533242.1 hypothetical protein VST7929_01106 [Vibrio stylophorae]